jgi:hypothetical protein
MAIIKKIHFMRAKDTLEIKNTCEAEFAERLREHIGRERIGRPSGGNREFSGVVTDNSFEIRRNSVAKLADYEVYGTFTASGNHVALTLKITQRPLEWILAIVSLLTGVYYVSEDIDNGRFDLLFIFVGSVILFSVVSRIGKSMEIQKLSGHIRKVFADKEII